MTPCWAISSSFQPNPMPNTNRPALSASSVAIGLGRDDRLALGDDADAGAEQDPVGDGGGRAQRDERVERALVLLGERRRRPSAGACGA